MPPRVGLVREDPELHRGLEQRTLIGLVDLQNGPVAMDAKPIHGDGIPGLEMPGLVGGRRDCRLLVKVVGLEPPRREGVHEFPTGVAAADRFENFLDLDHRPVFISKRNIIPIVATGLDGYRPRDWIGQRIEHAKFPGLDPCRPGGRQ